MRAKLLTLGVVAALAAGCSDTKMGSSSTPPGPSASAGPELLEPLVMPAKPDKTVSVRDALTRKEGETVVVSGRTPTEKVKPFNAAVASFLLMAPEDMEREEVKEEFDCDEAATCPGCKQLLDQYAVRVELVDQSGAVIPTSAEGFRGLKPGGTVTVEGEIKRDGKDKKLVRIVAKKFYPG